MEFVQKKQEAIASLATLVAAVLWESAILSLQEEQRASLQSSLNSSMLEEAWSYNQLSALVGKKSDWFTK